MGALAVFHDTGYIEAQSSKIWRETFLRALAQVVFIVLLTLVIVRWTISRPIARTAEWMRKMRTGRESHREPPPEFPQGALFQPLTHEVTHLARSPRGGGGRSLARDRGTSYSPGRSTAAPETKDKRAGTAGPT